MWKITIVALLGAVVVTVALLGFRGGKSERPPFQYWPDMVAQDKFRPQEATRWFGDGRTQRMPVAGTVPWGGNAQAPDKTFAVSDESRYALARLPLGIDLPLLLEGQRLYGVYCTVCHGGGGEGNGITTEYGMLNPPSYHQERIRKMPDGELYKVITAGKGTMGPYAGKLKPEQRWAVVAYVRALQRAFNVSIRDVPPPVRAVLEQMQR